MLVRIQFQVDEHAVEKLRLVQIVPNVKCFSRIMIPPQQTTVLLMSQLLAGLNATNRRGGPKAREVLTECQHQKKSPRSSTRGTHGSHDGRRDIIIGGCMSSFTDVGKASTPSQFRDRTSCTRPSSLLPEDEDQCQDQGNNCPACHFAGLKTASCARLNRRAQFVSNLRIKRHEAEYERLDRFRHAHEFKKEVEAFEAEILEAEKET